MTSKLKSRDKNLLLVMMMGGLLLLLFLSFIHINQGFVDISFNMILESFISPRSTVEQNVIMDLRLPRLIMGIIAGGVFGFTGTLFQSLMKNPLASSSTLGINAGAYFTVVLFNIFLKDFITGIPFLQALIGALGTAFIVVYLSGGKKAKPIQMTLVGTALSLVFSSITSTLQILYEYETKGLFLWGSGSLMQTNWKGITFSFPITFICFLICIIISPKLDILELGNDTASALGLNVDLYRYTGILIGVIATSAVVSVVGPIGFVGLIAPHIIKRMGFNKHKHIFLLSTIWGSVILVGADIISRLYTDGSYELPVGSFTAIIGAPWLIYLAYKTGKNLSNSREGLLFQAGKNKISYPILLCLLSGIIIIIFINSLKYGGQELSLKEIIEILSGSGNEVSSLIINKVRLPRAITALLAGIVLAVSGLLLQTVLNNTLADQSTIGITHGAGLGALFAIYFLSSKSIILIPICAFVGAVLSSLIIFKISKISNYSPSMLILVGIAVNAICSAGINIIVISTTVGKSASLVWLAGSTYSSSWNNVTVLLTVMAVIFPIAWILCKELDAVMLGEDIAIAIGSNVTKIRILTSIFGIFLAAIAVSTVGTVAFIGLLAPHMARFLVGGKHQKSMVISGLLGGLMLLISDLIGRVIIYPSEIPSGLIVSVIGAPYFLWLLYSTSNIKR